MLSGTLHHRLPCSVQVEFVLRATGSGMSIKNLKQLIYPKNCSPQAIQELLEFSRLSASMKRAASPDSRFSSRSPSPSDSRFSSGRVSPAISTMSGIVTRLKSSSLMPGTSSTSGMRKLSSSPHLLGICEVRNLFGINVYWLGIAIYSLFKN